MNNWVYDESVFYEIKDKMLFDLFPSKFVVVEHWISEYEYVYDVCIERVYLFIYSCAVPFKLKTAANKAKKNPAIPVAPTNSTSPPIKSGISVKNFNL